MSFSSDDDYDSFGPPSVSRGAFVFELGTLYARMDRMMPSHIRADPEELYRLLTYTPLPKKRTKAGTVAKKQPKDTHKDPDQHYYAAQMIHYGLKPLKTKAASKKTLLAAFGDGMTQSLEVPDSILDLEASMKAEWEILEAEYVEKLEQLHKKLARPSNPQALPSPSPTEEATKRSDMPSIEERVAALTRTRKPVNIPYKMTIAEIGTEIETLSLVQAREILTNLLGLHSSVRAAIQTEISSVKHNDNASDELVVNPAEWTGIYDIDVPSKIDMDFMSFEDGSGDPPSLTFEIYQSSTSSHLWAAFQFGFLWGFMRSINPAPKFLNKEIHFEYRGYSEARGNMMTFDDTRNRSVIAFLPGGLLEGKVSFTDCTFGHFQIYGALRNKNAGGNPTVRKTIAQQHAVVKWWKTEYRRITANNFGVAKYSGWAAWDGRLKDDQAFESDTTAGTKEHRVADLNMILSESDADDDDDNDGNSGADSAAELRIFFLDCVE